MFNINDLAFLSVAGGGSSGQTWADRFALIAVAGVIVIYFIIKNSINKKKEKAEADEAKKIEEISLAAETETEIEKRQDIDGDEEELIAVITAAVSAALQKPASGFRVVSFKKRSGWKN